MYNVNNNKSDDITSVTSHDLTLNVTVEDRSFKASSLAKLKFGNNKSDKYENSNSHYCMKRKVASCGYVVPCLSAVLVSAVPKGGRGICDVSPLTGISGLPV